MTTTDPDDPDDPDGPDGPDDDEIVLVEVEVAGAGAGAGAEYWDTPGGRVSTLVSLVQATVTGEPSSGGENEEVDLP